MYLRKRFHSQLLMFLLDVTKIEVQGMVIHKGRKIGWNERYNLLDDREYIKLRDNIEQQVGLNSLWYEIAFLNESFSFHYRFGGLINDIYLSIVAFQRYKNWRFTSRKYDLPHRTWGLVSILSFRICKCHHFCVWNEAFCIGNA